MLSENPLDYSDLMDLPLWVTYSYGWRLISNAKKQKEAMDNIGKNSEGKASSASLQNVARDIGVPVTTLPKNTIPNIHKRSA